MIIASTHYKYIQNRIDLHSYTQCLPPPSEFIHGDLWGSFIVLDRGDLELLQHMSKSLSQLIVTQA